MSPQIKAETTSNISEFIQFSEVSLPKFLIELDTITMIKYDVIENTCRYSVASTQAQTFIILETIKEIQQR